MRPLQEKQKQHRTSGVEAQRAMEEPRGHIQQKRGTVAETPLDGIQRLKAQENRSPPHISAFALQIFMELPLWLVWCWTLGPAGRWDRLTGKTVGKIKCEKCVPECCQQDVVNPGATVWEGEEPFPLWWLVLCLIFSLPIFPAMNFLSYSACEQPVYALELGRVSLGAQG
jgi:hypothetical protein